MTPEFTRSGGGRAVPDGATAQEAVAFISRDDRDSPEHCAACDRRFGYGKARLDDAGRIVHRNPNCVTWS